MIFWIFVILLVIGIAGCIKYGNDYHNDGWFNVSLMAVVVGGLVSLIMACFIVSAHLGVDGYIKKLNAHYDSMVYQYENDIYDNDNDLGKRELMVEINSWNESLAYKQEVQDDFWIGIFYPNIYDQFEQIPLKGK